MQFSETEVDGRGPGLIESAINTIDRLTDTVEDAGCVTGQNADRLMGSAPSDSGLSAETNSPNTVIERLTASLRRLDEAAANAQTQAHRLNEL